MKKYIKVKKSHIPETGIPKQPDLRLTLSTRIVLVSSTGFPPGCDLDSQVTSLYSRSSWRAMVWR